jgi:HAD domain in Swiss Army Knife RNA repair proteins
MQGRPIVFLDIDDVLCLNRPYSGFDVWQACRAKCKDPETVLANVFGCEARETLTAVHTLVGPIQFVLSSSWRLDFTRAEIEQVFTCNDLDFVAKSFAGDDSWATPETRIGRRADEIQAWLATHHRGEPFVVLDDAGSGMELADCTAAPGDPLFKRVVLCEVGVGLVKDLLPPIVSTLRWSCTRQ